MNIPFRPEIKSFSSRRTRFRAPAGALLVLLLTTGDVTVAELETHVGSSKTVYTLSTQEHPKKAKLAYMVTERHRVGGVGLAYTLDRWNFGPTLLTDGGKMIVTLDIKEEDGTRKLRSKKKTQCKARLWEEEWATYNQRECSLGWETNPDIEVEPGDLVLWTIKFKSMPRLEFEAWEDTVYRDRYTLEGDLFPPY